MFPHLEPLAVFIHHEGQQRELGTLTSLGSDVNFSWSTAAVDHGEEWSPLRLPLHNSQRIVIPSDFNGLAGLFHDALPDGWGRRVLGVPKPEDSGCSLALLKQVGHKAWGALSFGQTQHPPAHQIDLNEISRSVHAIEHNAAPFFPLLWTLGGWFHGARPKIAVDLNDNQQALPPDSQQEGFTPWLIKFAAQDEHPETSVGEDLYMQMAQQMGIDVMPHRVLILDGRPCFATQRFDRKNGQTIFTHSLSGLLHCSHRVANLDYIILGRVLRQLNPEINLEQAFRRVCFNAAFSVRDDHAKNISLMKKGSVWDLAPAYDLTYMTGPRGYHYMNFADCPERDPTREFVLRVGNEYGLSPPVAQRILNEAVETAFEMLQQSQGLLSASWNHPVKKRLKEICKGLRPSFSVTHRSKT